MGLVALGGVVYIAFPGEPTPTLTIRGPTMTWFVSEEDCPSTAHVEYLWGFSWGGDKPGLNLCFLDIDGQIPYAVAPTPPAEALRNELEDQRRKAAGEPPPLRLNAPWFHTGSEYDWQVVKWTKESAASLKITPELRERLKAAQSSARWRAHKEAYLEAAPWVVGICAFLWAITAAMGWIIRGFAGVPKGKDFRPSEQRR